MRSNLIANLRRIGVSISMFVVGCVVLLWPASANAGTKITQATCPIVISQPGEYQLVTDVTCAPATNGINITSSNVSLNLNGHTILGTPASGTCNIGRGVNISNGGPMLTGIDVSNGNINNFYIGLFASNTANSSARSVTVTANCPFFSYGLVVLPPGGQWSLKDNIVREPGISSTGIYVFGVNGNTLVHNDVNNTLEVADSNLNTIVNNTASDNYGGVILATFTTGSSNNEVHANRTNNNAAGGGLLVQKGSLGNNLSGNKSTNNLPFDMEDDNANCGTNSWQGNQFGTANQPCIQ